MPVWLLRKFELCRLMLFWFLVKIVNLIGVCYLNVCLVAEKITLIFVVLVFQVVKDAVYKSIRFGSSEFD